MGLRFIFMLARDDRTVEDAADHLETALSLGVRQIGFKDIGLPVEQLKALNRTIKADGATSYLEVVAGSGKRGRFGACGGGGRSRYPAGRHACR